jgi:N-acetylglucosamine-6-phosphate deacetylase
VTLAPELLGANPVIRLLKQNGVRVQMGHTCATASQTRAAQKAGVSGVTHLFNAMGPPDRRMDGIVDYALKDRSLYTELIVDGIHVSEDLIRHTLTTRPLKRILIVSDACSASGFPPGQRSSFAGGPIVTDRDGSVRRPDSTLVASGLCLPKTIQHLIDLGLLTQENAKILGFSNPLSYLGGASEVGCSEKKPSRVLW